MHPVIIFYTCYLHEIVIEYCLSVCTCSFYTRLVHVQYTFTSCSYINFEKKWSKTMNSLIWKVIIYCQYGCHLYTYYYTYYYLYFSLECFLYMGVLISILFSCIHSSYAIWIIFSRMDCTVIDFKLVALYHWCNQILLTMICCTSPLKNFFYVKAFLHEINVI